MSIKLSDNIRVGQQKPTDARFDNNGQAYIDIVDANAKIPLAERYPLMPVNVAGVEYWYKDGIENANLVKKEYTIYEHPDKTWVNKTALTAGNVISNLTVDSKGHPTDWAVRNLDDRYYTETEVDSKLAEKVNQSTVLSSNANLVLHKIAEIGGTIINETVTKLEPTALEGNVLPLKFTNENGVLQQIDIDLSGLVLTDTSVSNATYNASTNIITLNKSDGTSYEINLSEFSIIINTDANGITTLTQEGVIKATISRVGQSGSYNDLLNVPATFPPSSHSIGSHSDVTISTPATGELLKWNGTKWVNTTLGEAGIEPAITKKTAFNSDFGTTAGTVAEGNHNHSGVYEPVFSKNSAFNRNFGTAAGTVKEGNWVPTWAQVTDKPGNLAYTSDIPTNNNQLSNGEAYVKYKFTASTYSGYNNTDLDLATSGIFYSGHTNTPDVGNSHIIAQSLDANYVQQIGGRAGRLFFRHKELNVWGGWNELDHSGNLRSNSENDSRYLQSYIETDPTVPSHVKSITTTDINNWNTHPTLSEVLNRDNTSIDKGIILTSSDSSVLHGLLVDNAQDSAYAKVSHNGITFRTEVGGYINIRPSTTDNKLYINTSISSEASATSSRKIIINDGDNSQLGTPADIVALEVLGRVKGIPAVNSDELVTKGQLDGQNPSGNYLSTTATTTDVDDITTDLNTVRSGIFYSGSGALNQPPTGNSHILSQSLSSNYTQQIGGRLDRLFFRHQESGTWNPWRELYHSGNLDPSSFATGDNFSTSGSYGDLNVGKLGGLDYTNFLRSNANDSHTGTLTFDTTYWKSANNAVQRADNRDEVTTQSRLHWYGHTDTGGTTNFRHAWYDGDSYVDVTAENNGITFGGTLKASDFIFGSDKRLKKNITPLKPKRIKSKYVKYRMIQNDTHLRTGHIAQELEKYHPEYVRTDKEGMKSISYTDLHSAEIAYLKDRGDKMQIAMIVMFIILMLTLIFK